MNTNPNVVSVYTVTNRLNGDQYVGISYRPERRWTEHRTSAKSGKSQTHFHRAIRKYGAEAFDFEVQDTFDTRFMAKVAEIHLIESLKPAYNSTLGGDGVWMEVSQETRAKISAANTGRKATPEHCAAISAAKKGQKRAPFSPEHCVKLGQVNVGRKHTDSAREKMSCSALGRVRSPETRARMSVAKTHMWRLRRLRKAISTYEMDLTNEPVQVIS